MTILTQLSDRIKKTIPTTDKTTNQSKLPKQCSQITNQNYPNNARKSPMKHSPIT
ncbi:TPA: hypothetical protein SK643_001052 [Staphylococcus aureus]|nr:hypothetical protein [Staphylococcus aureus]HEI7149362.1 hypothetical protein [Staphylococcus aureus]